jgi:hypothetical protein
VRAAALLAMMTAAACGRREPSRADEAPAPPPVTARAIDAPAPPGAAAPKPNDARAIDAPDSAALRAAVAAIDEKTIASWMFDTRARATDASVPDPPAELAAAIDALVAWDQDGATFAVGCAAQDDPALFPHLTDTARAALAFAADPDDPKIHAVLHLAQALRDPDNAPVAIDVGTQLARDAAGWLVDNKQRPSELYETFAPEKDVIARDVRAGQRCALEHAHRALDAAHATGERALEELRAYCDETARKLLDAHGSEALGDVSRKQETARPGGLMHDPAADCRGDEAPEVAAAASAYTKHLERARHPIDAQP